MSNIESLDRLREFVEEDALLAEMVEAVEREVSEKFIELPVDADGVQIHVGDCLQLGDTRGEVVALTYCPANGKLPWEWQCDTGDWYNTAFAYHVKPRTVEDVLREFANEYNSSPDGDTFESLTAKYAEEIRGMMA